MNTLLNVLTHITLTSCEDINIFLVTPSSNFKFTCDVVGQKQMNTCIWSYFFWNSIWTISSPIWIISNHTIDQYTNPLLVVFLVIRTSSSYLRSFALLYNRLTSKFILVPNNVKIFQLFVTWIFSVSLQENLC